MKTISTGLIVITLGAVAFLNYGCSTARERGETISEPAGSAIYRDGEWKPVDTSRFRQVPSDGAPGYYDSRGVWHAGGR